MVSRYYIIKLCYFKIHDKIKNKYKIYSIMFESSKENVLWIFTVLGNIFQSMQFLCFKNICINIHINVIT